MIFIGRKNEKMFYYVVELKNLHSFRKATIVFAKSLRGAKWVLQIARTEGL